MIMPDQIKNGDTKSSNSNPFQIYCGLSFVTKKHTDHYNVYCYLSIFVILAFTRPSMFFCVVLCVLSFQVLFLMTSFFINMYHHTAFHQLQLQPVNIHNLLFYNAHRITLNNPLIPNLFRLKAYLLLLMGRTTHT